MANSKRKMSTGQLKLIFEPRTRIIKKEDHTFVWSSFLWSG